MIADHAKVLLDAIENIPFAIATAAVTVTLIRHHINGVIGNKRHGAHHAVDWATRGKSYVGPIMMSQQLVTKTNAQDGKTWIAPHYLLTYPNILLTGGRPRSRRDDHRIDPSVRC